MIVHSPSEAPAGAACEDCGAGTSATCSPNCPSRTPVDNVIRPTIWQDNADRAATRDRVEQADLVLDVAVKDAIAQIRDGRPGWAHYRLARAQERAGRILGPTDWSTLAGGAR